jgi:GT2 family glycosyltransferase
LPAESVSVLIPTLDAGPGFERVLAAVSAQEGFEDVDLVVVDSGSVDGTPDAARREGARVVSISRDEFGHGRTRNYAAEISTGSILVLLVQDALLLGRTAIRDLVDELLAEEGVAAVSARQVPRSDADLYGAFVIHNHYQTLWGSKDLPLSRPAAMRAAATVDDVCAAVRREAWEEIRFADVGFAEDLEFGIRALARGWTLRLSQRAAVAHSHTRTAGYHLRRSVADRLYVAPLLDDRAVSRASTVAMEELLAAAVVCLQELAGAFSAVPDDSASLTIHVSRIRALLEAGAPRLALSGELEETAWLVDGDASRPVAGRVVSDLRHALLRVLASDAIERFSAAHRHVSTDEATGFTAKAAASVVGRVIGDALRIEPNEPVRRLLAGV